MPDDRYLMPNPLSTREDGTSPLGDLSSFDALAQPIHLSPADRQMREHMSEAEAEADQRAGIKLPANLTFSERRQYRQWIADTNAGVDRKAELDAGETAALLAGVSPADIASLRVVFRRGPWQTAEHIAALAILTEHNRHRLAFERRARAGGRTAEQLERKVEAEMAEHGIDRFEAFGRIEADDRMRGRSESWPRGDRRVSHRVAVALLVAVAVALVAVLYYFTHQGTP